MSFKYAPQVGNNIPKRHEPVLGDVNEPRKWVFSFQLWRQRNFFGLNRSRRGWFVSLLKRLQALSSENIELFQTDFGKRKACRYHEINWDQPNIPLQRSDLNWIPPRYGNDEEYPILQVQLSTSMGRIIGFWDENYVFNIVLLDPYHNMQPSKEYGYKLDTCDPAKCDYSSLIHRLDRFIIDKCNRNNCEHADELASIGTIVDELWSVNVVLLKLNDDVKQRYEELRDAGYADSIHAIIANKIDELTDEYLENLD